MRTSRISAVPALAGGAMQLICGPSNTRVGVLISVDVGIGYITDQVGAPALTGIAVTPSTPLHLRIEDWGDLLHHPLYGSNNTGGANFGFIECQQPQPPVSGNAAAVS